MDPSWTTALSEAKAASRHVQQASAALERLSRELEALRDWSETTARLDLARALTEGPDGGALQALVAAASGDVADGDVRRASEMLLDRLTAALGLEPICERGEQLCLSADDLAEFDVRGGQPTTRAAGRSVYCVARPGWQLGGRLVVRPLLEPIG
jgi:hypothetical protein